MEGREAVGEGKAEGGGGSLGAAAIAWENSEAVAAKSRVTAAWGEDERGCGGGGQCERFGLLRNLLPFRLPSFLANFFTPMLGAAQAATSGAVY